MCIQVNEIADMIYNTILDCAASNDIMTYREQARCIANDLIKNDVIRQPVPDIKENQVLYVVIADKVIDIAFKGMVIADGDIRLNFDHRGMHYHCTVNDINKRVFVSRTEAETKRRRQT